MEIALILIINYKLNKCRVFQWLKSEKVLLQLAKNLELNSFYNQNF